VLPAHLRAGVNASMSQCVNGLMSLFGFFGLFGLSSLFGLSGPSEIGFTFHGINLLGLLSRE
jgi:hypothetical protein